MNIPNSILPYSDELLIWDDQSQKYYLTEKTLIDEGLDIRGKLARNKANNPESVLNGFINRVTYEVYKYIHGDSAQTELIDYFIAVCPSLREKIRLALINQAIYMRRNGDSLLSPEKEIRENYIDPIAISILNERVPELENPITYRGEWIYV